MEIDDIWSEYHQRLLGFIKQRVTEKDAEDVLQDVFVKIHSRLDSLDEKAKRKNGCCSACVVEVDGEQKFACSTTPKGGMSIVVNRDDLKEIRKKRLKKYSEGIKSGNPCTCSSPDSDNESCS